MRGVVVMAVLSCVLGGGIAMAKRSHKDRKAAATAPSAPPPAAAAAPSTAGSGAPTAAPARAAAPTGGSSRGSRRGATPSTTSAAGTTAAREVVQRESHIEFDERLVQGQSAAGAIYLFQRGESEFRSMVRMPDSFRERTVRKVLPPAPQRQ